jgi:LacI family transcriptional regulator
VATKKYIFGIYGDARQEVVSRRFSGVLQYCSDHKIQVRDFRRVNVIDDFHDIPPAWKSQVDGVVLCIGRAFHLPEQELADWVVGGGVPAVSTSADWTDPRIPLVHCNHGSLAKIAAKHLASMDCRSFLFVGYDHSIGSTSRGEEFRKTLSARDKKTVLHTGQIRYNGSSEDEELALGDHKLVGSLEKMVKPLGVWCLNDATASAISLLCKRLQIEVPNQVKILGVDDTSITRMQLPMLSSIHTPGEEIGYKAASIVMDLLLGRKVAKVTDVPESKLVIRESTMPFLRSWGEIEDVIEYIARHACEGISVEELPKILGVSRRTFQDTFFAQTGRTPLQEIHRVRLERAKTLLKETQISISRIASMVGFQEMAAFGKFFRNQTGLTPREYREQE